MIKVLVIDHNDVARKALRNILKDEFGYTVIEAADGIEGIDQYAKNLPDIILIDVEVPFLDGPEFIELLRSDPQFKEVFIIAMAMRSNKAALASILQLGIREIIFKPLDTEDVKEKIRNIITQHAGTLRQNIVLKKLSGTFTDENRTILVADRDDYFREYFKSLLGDRFKILFAPNGAECLSMFVKHKPTVVCLGENLPFINEKLLAAKMRQLDKNFKTEIYLVSSKPSSIPSHTDYYEDVITKSYDPEEFLIEFSRKVLRNDGLFDVILGIISSFNDEVNRALKGAFESLAQIKIKTLPATEVGSISPELSAISTLTERREQIKICIMLTGTQPDIASITKKMFSTDLSFEKGVLAAFGDLLNIVSGKLAESMTKKGITTELKELKVKYLPEEFDTATYRFLHPFETDQGKRFLLAILLFKPEKVDSIKIDF